jgi:hypothetical protein
VGISLADILSGHDQLNEIKEKKQGHRFRATIIHDDGTEETIGGEEITTINYG